jgi:putative flippase GtrA
MQLSSVTEKNTPGFLTFLRQQAWYQQIANTSIRPLRPFIGELEAKRMIKYGMVGVLGTIIELTMLNFFIFFLGWTSDFQKIGANVIAVSVAICSNFVWNRLWTFPESRGNSRGKQFVKFALVSVVGVVINSLIFFLSDKFIYSPWMSSVLAVQLAKVTAIGVTLTWNFSVNRLWTFNPSKKPL